jgi:hypothetical protein
MKKLLIVALIFSGLISLFIIEKQAREEKVLLNGLSPVEQKTLRENTKKIAGLRAGDIVKAKTSETYKVIGKSDGLSTVLFLQGPGPASNPNKSEIHVKRTMSFVKENVSQILAAGEKGHYLESTYYNEN